MVTVAHDGNLWKLMFVLDENLGEDREEVEDIAVEFEALQEKPVAYDATVSVTKNLLETV